MEESNDTISGKVLSKLKETFSVDLDYSETI